MSELGLSGGRVPTVDAPSALARYRALYKAIQAGLVSACHDLSDGGLAVAVAEMCIGGRIGAVVDVDAMKIAESLTLTERLYSESASRLLVSVPAAGVPAFGGAFSLLSSASAPRASVKCGKEGLFPFRYPGIEPLFAHDVEELARAFKGTLNW